MENKSLYVIILFLCVVIHVNAQQRLRASYDQLKSYEGVYEYFNHTTLQMAVSPKDTMLYAVIGKSPYALRPDSIDVFLNNGNQPVRFLRDQHGTITGYSVNKQTFHRLRSTTAISAAFWFPRLVTDPQHYQYHYKEPEQTGDGLQTGSLPDPGLLQSLMQKIVAGQYPNIHSILILKENKLVFEEYFYGYTRDSLQEMRSASKSVVSAVTGIAINKGLIRSVREKLSDLLPDYHFANPSQLKNRITLEDILDNQSGVDYDEYAGKSTGNENDMNASDDWVKYTFDLPMLEAPGTVGRYNSGNPITAGWIIEKHAGMTMHDFAAKNLFGPLGITDFKWDFRPDRSNIDNFCQVILTPRDMAKFGLLYMNSGAWQGQQILPADWAATSIRKHSVVAGVDYGYLWWLKHFDADGKRYYSFGAQGNGGQKIYGFAEQHLLVITTGGNYNSQSPVDELIRTYILPAFNKN